VQLQAKYPKKIMKESVIYQDIWDEARTKGIEEGVRRVAINLLRNGITPEDVVKYTGLSLEEVEPLRSQLN
jgi:predicted transposase/invertase (TIGR01784 family)